MYFIVSGELIFIYPDSKVKLIWSSKFLLKEKLKLFKTTGSSEEKRVVSNVLKDVGGKLTFSPGFQKSQYERRFLLIGKIFVLSLESPLKWPNIQKWLKNLFKVKFLRL